MTLSRLVVLLSLTLGIANCSGNSSKNDSTATAHRLKDSKELPVTVYYFHSEHRCPTCLAIEDETRTVLELNFKSEVDSGKLELQIINIDEGVNKQVCGKYKVYGSALLLVRGDTEANLTNMAFSNARSNPEKFREGLNDEIKRLLN
ncbi:MAG: nitrophenyl compound nitroreductase subunit ArsF family protein [Bacteroidales bacterium]